MSKAKIIDSVRNLGVDGCGRGKVLKAPSAKVNLANKNVKWLSVKLTQVFQEVLS